MLASPAPLAVAIPGRLPGISASPPRTLIDSLASMKTASEKISREGTKLPADSARSKAAELFEGKGSAKDLADPPAGTDTSAKDGRSSGLKSSAPAPKTYDKKVPSPAKRKSGFKRWHKWVAWIVILLMLATGSLYVHYRPQIDDIFTGPPLVVVEDRTVHLDLDLTASITKSESGAIILAGHEAAVASVAVSPDGGTMVTVSADGSWKVWDLATGMVRAPRQAMAPVEAARITSDGRLILLHEDSTIRLLDIATGRLQKITIDAGNVSFYSFSPDLKNLAVATGADRLQIVDLETGKSRAFKTENILTLAYTTDAVIFMTTNGPKLRIWSVGAESNPEVVMDKLAPGVVLKEAAISADGTRVAAAGEAPGANGVLYLKDTQLVGSLANDQLGGRRSKVASIAMDPSGTKVAIITTKGKLWLWQPMQEDLVLVGRLGSGSKVFFSPDGSRIFATDRSGAVQIWAAP